MAEQNNYGNNTDTNNGYDNQNMPQSNGYYRPNQNAQNNGYYNQNQNAQSNGYYNPNQNTQSNGYYNPNPNTQNNGYYNQNQNTQSNGYYNPNQNTQNNGYYNPNPNTQNNGYYNPNQNAQNNGSYNSNPNMQANQAAVPINPNYYIPPEIKSAERNVFKNTIIRLAAFTAIVILNSFLLQRILFDIAVVVIRLFAEAGAPSEVSYLLVWLTNDVGVYLIPSLAAFFLFKKDFDAHYKYPPRPYFQTVNYTFLTFFASCFLGSLASLLANFIAKVMDSIWGTGEIPDAMEGSVPEQGEVSSLLIMILFVGLIAPVVEEIIFRRLLLFPFRKHGDWFAVIISATLFSFYHGNFDQMPYAFVTGVLFALLAVNSGSVVPTVILHIANNMAVCLSQYLIKVTGEVEPFISISNYISGGLNLSFWIGIPSIAIMIAAKYFKSYRPVILKPNEKAKELFKNPAFYLFMILTALMMVEL